MNFFRIFFLLLLITSLVNCATNTIPFEEGKPLEANGTFWSRSFKQNGKVLRYDTVIDGLKQYDSTNSKAKIAEAWDYSGIVSAGLGGGFIGYYLFDTVDSSGTRGTGFIIGAVLVGAGFLFSYFGDQALVEGAGIYNNEVKYKTSQSHIQPVFDVTSLGYGNALVPYVGLKITNF